MLRFEQYRVIATECFITYLMIIRDYQELNSFVSFIYRVTPRVYLENFFNSKSLIRLTVWPELISGGDRK